MRIVIKYTIITLLFCWCLTTTANAESSKSGTLTGIALDEATQQPVIGATIQLLDTSKGVLADDDGKFTISDIPVGSYLVKISRIGYKPMVKSNVIINPQSITHLVVEMTMQYIEMEGVEVQASYFDKAKDAIVSTRTMDYEEIREQPGGIGDIQRVMQALPAVVSAADQQNEIIIRGGAPGENLFLMDNVEIPNPNHFGQFGSTGGPINMLNAEFIREVDFIAGAFPAKYGDKASSVMDISFREGNRQRMFREIGIDMAGAGGLIEGPINKGKGSYLFSARKSYLDFVVKNIGMTAVPRYYSIQGKVVYDISPSQKLIVNGVFGDDDIHLEEETTGYGSGSDMDVESASQRFASGLVLKSLLSSKGYSLLTLSHSQTQWDETVTNVDNGNLYWRNDTIEQENTLKYDLTYVITPHLELGVGVSAKQTLFDYALDSDPDTLWLYFKDENQTPRHHRDDPVVDSVVVRVDTLFVREDASAYKYGGYLQLRYHPFSRLMVQGGVRYDHFTYTDHHYLSPRLGASLNLTERTAINAAYGIHYQAPAYYELTHHPANKDLEHKYTTQYVIGLEHLFANDFRGTLEFYYKKYDDVPVRLAHTTPEPNDYDEGRFLNAGTGTARGVELFLQKKLSHHLYGTISYSYSIAEADDPRFPDQTYDWDFDYRHVFTFIAGYRFDMTDYDWYMDMSNQTWYKLTAWLLPFADQVQLGIRWRYLGGRPYTAPVYHPEHKQWWVEEQAELNPDRLPVYHRLDVRLDRRFFFNAWNLVTFIDVGNIYGRHNIWDYSYDEDGDRETIYQFETLPVGGVLIEF